MKKLIALFFALLILTSVCPALAEYTDSETILAVQKALADAGIYKGNLSGIKGNATENAIRTYQQKNGLKVNGQIDDDLLDSLGLLSDEVILVSKITLNEESVSLSKGGNVTLTATVEPRNARNKKVEWFSTDEAVATVKDGKVTAKANGTCDIICRALDDSGVETVCHVAVIVMVSSVTTTQNQKVTIPYGGFVELTATAKPVDATNTTLKWSSSNESICVVDENGKVTSVGSGDCEIECSTTDGSKKSLKFQIHVPIFDKLEVSYTITEKGWNVIPIDLHGALARDISYNKVSSEKYFMYYFDHKGIHIYPIAEGEAQVTLTSKLNKQDQMKVNFVVEKSATYVDEEEPLNVIITVDQYEVLPGDSYNMRYRISGGKPPYTINKARVQNTDLHSLTVPAGTKTIRAASFLDSEQITMLVSDSAGNVCFYSICVKKKTLDAHFDYQYYTMTKEMIPTIPYTIADGSGSYIVRTSWAHTVNSIGIMSYYANETFASGRTGFITFTPPKTPLQVGDSITLEVYITDQKNNQLRWERCYGIEITEELVLKVAYDKYDVRVGDTVTVLLNIENGTLSALRYAQIDEYRYDAEEATWKPTDKKIQWKKSDYETGQYYYQYNVKDLDYFYTRISWGMGKSWCMGNQIFVKK